MELTDAGKAFLESEFWRYNVKKDGFLTLQEQAELFSTCPCRYTSSPSVQPSHACQEACYRVQGIGFLPQCRLPRTCMIVCEVAAESGCSGGSAAVGT